MRASTDTSGTIEMEPENEIIQISAAIIKNALCYQMSLTKKYCLIGTNQGMCLVDNAKKSFKRFENQKNPFRKDAGTGVMMGTALEERSQVAVIPSRNSKNYQKTVVYIFDYQLNTILYRNNFILPIRQITLTDNTIMVSNNKRLILYNYSNDNKIKDQLYYLQGYTSTQPNTRIRYFQMMCEEKIFNNSVNHDDEDGEGQLLGARECLCGKYSVSWVKPYRILYSKVFTLNGKKTIQLSIYDAAYDSDYSFDSLEYNEPFTFMISQDGNLVAFTYNFSRNVCIKKVGTKETLCNLFVSNAIKPFLTHGFVYFDEKIWYTSLRKGENSIATMHFFRIDKKIPEKEVPRANYTRYLNLFNKTLADYGISNTLIGPDFYVIDGAVLSPSVCGAVIEVIDFTRSGNLIKKTSEDMLKWVEDLS